MRYLSALTILQCLLLGACGLGHRLDHGDRVHAEWQRNEAILQRAIWGVSNSEELDGSLRFFYELTGLTIRGNYSTFGFFPTEETKEDLRTLREWYKVNRDNLYWDEQDQAVKFRQKPEGVTRPSPRNESGS
jgi:hypothetical protein